MFLATSLGQYAYQNYETVWELAQPEDNVLALMTPAAQAMIRFFGVIKARSGSKIFLTELLGMGIDADTYFTLISLIIVKLGTERVQYYPNGNDSFFVYNG